MPFNGSGTYNPISTPDFPAVPGTTVRSAQYNNQIVDMATALSQCITRDGQSVPTVNLPMGGFKLTGLGAPLNSRDSLRQEQIRRGADIASATTVVIPVEGGLFDITGTTNITGFAPTFSGRNVVVVFTDVLTLDHNTNFRMPGGADITTRAGDMAGFVCVDGTIWECYLYPRVQNSSWFGVSEPLNPWPGMPWADLGTKTMWRRNVANDAWLYEHRILEEANTDLPWLSYAVGHEFPMITDAPIPPKTNPNYRYVLLTAGLTGAGQYNEGVLTAESVTGSDPTVVAVATVNLVGSPLHNKIIDLINTSRPFIRPAPAASSIINSQNLIHLHDTTLPRYAGGISGNTGWSGGDNFISGGYVVATSNSGGNEARPRYIPRRFWMRIK